MIHEIKEMMDGGNDVNARPLQEVATKVFADINRWRWAVDAHFFPENLVAAGNTRGAYYTWPWMEHPLFFCAPRPDGKCGYKNVAIVGQPYDGAWGYEVRHQVRELREQGYAVHVPPNPLASIHSPGRTLWIVVTQPGTAVRWVAGAD